MLAAIFMLRIASEAKPVVNEDIRSGQLVFSAALGHHGLPWTLILLDLQTGTQRMLVDYSNGNYAVAPIWSPDGKQLLYSMNPDCVGVYVYDLDTDRRERIDQPTEWGNGCEAVWSPNGDFIAYMSTRDLRPPHFDADLYVFDRRTRVHRRLTTASGGFPVWTPDGAWIVYYSPARGIRNFRIRPDGTGDSAFPTLFDPALFTRGFTWSPDGKQMAFSAATAGWPAR